MTNYSHTLTNIVKKTQPENFTTILVVDNCANAPCLNSGSCTNGINTYSCSCLPGYTGYSCQSGKKLVT